MEIHIKLEEDMPKKLQRRIRKVKTMVDNYQKTKIRDYKLKLTHEYMDLGRDLLMTFDEEKRTELKRKMSDVQRKYDEISKFEF